MNDNTFFDIPSACHETLYAYVQDILDGRNMDEDLPEKVAVLLP